MMMMSEIERIRRTLPGIDCGACGAPSCRAFAEDIVRGIAGDRVCPVMSMRQADNRKSDKEDPE